MTAAGRTQDFSKIREAVATWTKIRQLLRSGDQGQIIPVVIPKDRRGFGPFYLAGLGVYLGAVALLAASDVLRLPLIGVALLVLAVAFVWWWRASIVEIEQGTTGIRSSYGQVVGTLSPGRHYLWWPWQKVEAVVDTSTEIPYTAPVLACPTRDSVPLKAIEFFLKFRIEDPIAFVR
ncbi:MAG TPA: SPFH domain-containing protein, partial [Herpetosiphonaceae bacterium]|nr:SPFH domain-containing protein [Herpetosiphonaceae bacterium]